MLFNSASYYLSNNVTLVSILNLISQLFPAVFHYEFCQRVSYFSRDVLSFSVH